MSPTQPMAYPLKGFRVGPTPDTPTVAVIEMITDRGSGFYAVNKTIMKQMMTDLQSIIDVMPDTQ